MYRTDVIVIGAGQAGLAASYCLSEWGLDHVVLERGRVGQRWRSERWDSLRLLTPNWQSRLPGWAYRGSDPDGYMNMNEVIDYLAGYARSLPIPVRESTPVDQVVRQGSTFLVSTAAGTFRAGSVIVATGACDKPYVPPLAGALSPQLVQTVPTRYRRPGDLPEGGVLVVGASASGIQIADELAGSGRKVVLSVGRHTRLPRIYRGRDIMWWLDAAWVLREPLVQHPRRAQLRREPSLQLIGSPERRSLDLGTLTDRGVELIGRVVAADGTRVRADDNLGRDAAHADVRMGRLLGRIDRYIERHGLSNAVGERGAPEPLAVTGGDGDIDLAARGIASVVWATGFRRNYDWLRIPGAVSDGELRHRGGITEVPGLAVLGLPAMRTRRSTYIDGVGADARAIVHHLAGRHKQWRNAA